MAEDERPPDGIFTVYVAVPSQEKAAFELFARALRPPESIDPNTRVPCATLIKDYKRVVFEIGPHRPALELGPHAAVFRMGSRL